MDWLLNPVFWHWWILAGVLLIIELSAPVFFFLWLGIAAAATGLLTLAFPGLSLETQLVLFAALSVVAIIAWRRFREARPALSDQPNLNRRGQQYTGRVFTLDEPITNGVGKITVDDSTWRVKGPDLPAGSRVRVAGVDGVVFIVEPHDG
ncbi:MAG: NfeD family protein [Xanthomonadales bacterium]|nr:NfeD family protein [Xanthomonadales bacterium]